MTTRSKTLLSILKNKVLKQLSRLTPENIILGQAAHPRRIEPGTCNPPEAEHNIMPEFCRLVSGAMKIRLGNYHYRMEPGDYCLIPRMTIHQSPEKMQNEPFEALWFGFPRADDLWVLHTEMNKERQFKRHSIIHFTIPVAVIKMFNYRDRESTPDPMATKRDLIKLGAILDEKIRTGKYHCPTTFEERKPWKQRALSGIKEYLHDHFTEKLTLEQIAGRLDMSTSHLRTLFKLEYGDSVFEYLINLRLKKAVELLNDPKYTITRIADELNYEDIFFFSKQFKKYFGISPTDYRNRYLFK